MGKEGKLLVVVGVMLVLLFVGFVSAESFIQSGKCGDGICDSEESTPSSLDYCPQDCDISDNVSEESIQSEEDEVIDRIFDDALEQDSSMKFWVLVIGGIILVIFIIYFSLRRY